jgi:glycosyltransferase involved in cell wall biosynthesis
VQPDRKNILYLSSFGNFRWGGQKSLYHLATRLDPVSYRPHVIVPSEDGLSRVLRGEGVGVTVFELPQVAPRTALQALRAMRFLLDRIHAEGIDLIHTDGPRNTFYAGIAARLKGIPLVWHVRAMDGDRYDGLLYRLATRIILVADALRERFRGAAGAVKCVTIHNGVNLDEFHAGCSALPAELGIPPGRLVIACTGRIEPYKGQKSLIEACKALKQAGVDFHLLLVGETVEHSYEQVCRSTAASLGIEKRVTFAGHRDDMARLLAAVDVFALPSVIREAFPRSVIEAMASSKPVVVTRGGGAPEAVEEGISGFVVGPGEPAPLADRLLRLATDDAMRREMGKAARQRVETLFSLEENARKTQDVYQSLLGGNGRV